MDTDEKQIRMGLEAAKNFFKFHLREIDNQYDHLEKIFREEDIDKGEVESTISRYRVTKNRQKQISKVFTQQKIEISKEQIDTLVVFVQLILGDPLFSQYHGGVRNTIEAYLLNFERRLNDDKTIEPQPHFFELFDEVEKEKREKENILKDLIKNWDQADDFKIQVYKNNTRIIEIDNVLVSSELENYLIPLIHKSVYLKDAVGSRASHPYLHEISYGIMRYLIEVVNVPYTDEGNIGGQIAGTTSKILEICGLEVNAEKFSEYRGKLKKDKIDGEEFKYNAAHNDYLRVKYREIYKLMSGGKQT